MKTLREAIIAIEEAGTVQKGAEALGVSRQALTKRFRRDSVPASLKDRFEAIASRTGRPRSYTVGDRGRWHRTEARLVAIGDHYLSIVKVKAQRLGLPEQAVIDDAIARTTTEAEAIAAHVPKEVATGDQGNTTATDLDFLRRMQEELQGLDK